jgi:uncharacterized protein (TIGR02266 family)
VVIGKKILLADGNGIARDWGKTDLDRKAYHLLVVFTGVEAYEAAVFERPDLIVMSVQLPELTGDDCCRRLKAHPELRNIPVVLVACGAEVDELERCRRSGCEDLLFQPVDWRLLAEICRKYLDIRPGVSPRVSVQMTVRYGSGSDRKQLSDFSINVSTGGLFIETDAPLSVDTPLSLEFSLPGHPTPVCCQGRVAWLNAPGHRQNPRLPSGMGIQFVELALEDMRLVRAFTHQELEGSQGPDRS